jgi:hypothetical protein
MPNYAVLSASVCCMLGLVDTFPTNRCPGETLGKTATSAWRRHRTTDCGEGGLLAEGQIEECAIRQ